MRQSIYTHNIQVWDGVSDARIGFSASLLGLGAPGQGMARITENLNLQRGLLRHLDSLPEIRILDKVKVQSIDNGDGLSTWPLVHLDNGQVLRSRLLVKSHVTALHLPTPNEKLYRWVRMVSTHQCDLLPKSLHSDGRTTPKASLPLCSILHEVPSSAQTPQRISAFFQRVPSHSSQLRPQPLP